MVYDTNLQVITTFYSDGSPMIYSGGVPVSFDFWSISHTSGITRVEMIGGSLEGGMPDAWGIDDLTYIQMLPEPATLLLLTLGGLGIANRKVKRD